MFLRASSTIRRNFQIFGIRFQSNLPQRKLRFAYPEGVVPYENDYTESPQYPEINEETHQWTPSKKLKRKELLDWHKLIQDQPNPEAKTLELNMPRRYGYRTRILREDLFDYDSEGFYKFLTQTHFASSDTLPETYSDTELTDKAKHYAEKIKHRLFDAVQFEVQDQKRSYENNLEESAESIDFKRSLAILGQVNRVILSELSKNVEHLRNCQVDYAPKIEAFWFVGGQSPRYQEIQKRKQNAKRIEKFNKKSTTLAAPIKTMPENEPVERAFQYKGSPLLQVRCDKPISNFINGESSICQLHSDEQKIFPYEASVYGIQNAYNYASIIPGTWAGDSHSCSHITFHPRHHLLVDTRRNNKYWTADNECALQSQAALASFGRLFAQAFYHGFDQFSGIDYPFSGQTVITDGLNWSFYAYQLNTVQLCELYLNKHKKVNVCWGTKSMQLLSQENPGTINSDTLETLLKFYLNPPNATASSNPTPYLKSSITNMENEINRELIFHNYRDMVSQRWYLTDSTLNRQYPEIYEWEKIYKVKHYQRYMEPRRRFFEFPKDFPGANPYLERYRLVNPRHLRKRFKFLLEQHNAKKEAERIEAAKQLEKSKYLLSLPEDS